MSTFKQVRLDKAKEELTRLETAMREGSSEPTQPRGDNEGGSPPEKATGTAGQEVKQTEIIEEVKDLEFWKKEALEYKQRFSVSKAKYDVNIRKEREANEALKLDRIKLQRELNEARQELTKKNGDSIDEAFNQETVDVLGERTAEALKKQLKDTQERLDAYEKKEADKRLKDEEEEVTRSRASRYTEFTTELKSLVPDFEVLNADPKFMEFLGQTDSLGRLRFDVLRNRESIKDASGVAEFFLEYKKGKVKQPKKDTISARTGVDSSSSEVIAPKSEIITEGFIKKFYHDVATKKYVGRHEERKAIESRIDKAYLSGNIKPN